MAVDDSERYLYSSGDDGIVAKWDLNGPWDEGEALLTSPRAIYTISHLQTNNWLVAGSSEGILYIYDLSEKKLLHSIQLGSGAIFALHEDLNTQSLWVLQGKGLLSELSLSDAQLLGQSQISDAHLRSIQVSADGQHYFIGCSDHHIHCWHPIKKRILYSWKAHENSVFSLQLHPNGKQLISGGRDAHLTVWDLSSPPTRSQSLPAHLYTINDLCLSPDGKSVVSASRDKTIKLWNLDQETGHLDLIKVVDAARHDGHKHSVNKILWLRSDNSVLSCSDDRRLVRWRMTIDNT